MPTRVSMLLSLPMSFPSAFFFTPSLFLSYSSHRQPFWFLNTKLLPLKPCPFKYLIDLWPSSISLIRKAKQLRSTVPSSCKMKRSLINPCIENIVPYDYGIASMGKYPQKQRSNLPIRKSFLFPSSHLDITLNILLCVECRFPSQ